MPKASIRLAIVALTAVSALTGAFAESTIPFADDFETYPNLTPLIDGVNGWYGSSSNIIVQINTVRTGTNAAMIPVDCTLSNRFQSSDPTNVWIQMDVQPSFYDSTNPPVVDTNTTWLFYINTNGNFVVHNGSATDPSNSTSWVVTTNNGAGTNAHTWVRINIYQNFLQTNWDLYANGVLVTNAIGFVNTNATDFTGLDAYSGSQTSYLDNVSVVAMDTNEPTQRPLIVIPPTPSVRNIFVGATPSVQTTKVYNAWPNDIGFEITTNSDWVSAVPVNTNVVAGTTQDVTLTYASTALWQGGVSNAIVTVVATNGTDRWNTQTVAVVINVMNLTVTPTNMTNSVMVGLPTTRTFDIGNAGVGSFQYTVGITDAWLSCSSLSGSVGAFSTNTLTLTFTNTAGWTGGTSNTTVTIASTDGGGATQSMTVTLIVYDVAVTPAALTNAVMVGLTPTNQAIVVSNQSASTYRYTVGISNAPWLSCSVTNGTVGATSADTQTLFYAITTGWTPGVSNASISVASSNGDGAVKWVSVHLDLMQLQATPTNLTNSIMVGKTPAAQSFAVSNAGSGTFNYTVTNVEWASSSSTNGTLGPYGSNTITANYAGSLATWPVGTISNTTLTVASSDGGGATQTVAVTMNVMQMLASPTNLTNNVMVGLTPTNQIIVVTNAGAGIFQYTASTLSPWLFCSPTSGTVSAFGTSAFTLTFTNTAGWAAGTSSNAAVTIVSGDGGGATQTVAVTLNLYPAVGDHYVATNGGNTYPYTNWTMAAQSIQDAANVALVNSRVWVSNGIYVLANQVTLSNNIMIIGTGGVVTVDGNNATRCFYFNAGVTGGLANLTITRGYTNDGAAHGDGGGLYGNAGGFLTITNCSFISNTAANAGGGALFSSSLGIVANCIFDGNTCVSNTGGGLYCSYGGSDPRGFVISNSYFSNNSAYAYAGGVYVSSKNILVTDCTIARNTMLNDGGGSTGGGGIYYVGDSSVQVRNCLIEHNSSARLAGGAYGYGGIIRNCLIRNNTAALSGGGMRLYDGTANPTVSSCTIVSNYSPAAGGILATLGTAVTGMFENCIIYLNSGAATYSNYQISAVSFSNCCTVPAPTNYSATVTSTDNITNNPRFIDWPNGNYRLTPDSPCINTGTNRSWMTNTVDLDGNPRIINTTVDMGAYENPTVFWSVIPTTLTNAVMKGLLATNQSFVVTNAGEGTFDYNVTVTNDWIHSCTPSNGTLGSLASNMITVAYTNAITNWPAGTTSNTTVAVVISKSGLYPAQTQTVNVILSIMDFQVTPAKLTNNVMAGFTPASQRFIVTNAGVGTFNYRVTFTNDWIHSCTPSNGTLGSLASNMITVAYSNSITNWLAGAASNTTIMIASTDGGGASQTVDVAMNVMARPVLGLYPSSVTQAIARGANPVTRQFSIWNGSTSPVMPMAYTLTVSNRSPLLIQSLDSGGGESTGQTNWITINYMDISDAAAGVYTASVQVVARDSGTTYWPTGMVQLSATLLVSVEVVALVAPSGVTASDGTYADHVVVSWDPVVNAVNYIVYRSLTFDSEMAEPIGEPIGTSFNDLTGMAGVRYYYWVSSVNSDGGEGSKSTNREIGYRGLAAPGGLFATDGAYTNMVRVTWPLVDGATGYQLYRGVPGGTLAPLYFTAGGVYEDMSVVGGVHYEYKVGATNGVFGSALSVGETGYAFGAPGGLTASKGTYVGKVQVTWNAVDSASEYEVWRSTRAVLPSGGGAVKMATVTTPVFDDASVSAGVTYYYWVRGYGLEAGIGGWSAMDHGYGASAGVDLWVTNLVVLPVQVGLGGSPVIVSFRMGNGGGTNMAGANGTVGIEFFASTNQVFGADETIGKVVGEVTLEAGADMVMNVAGSHLVVPQVEGDYNIFVRVLPESPSLLADTNPNDNVTKRNGSVRVRSSGALNYQVFNDYDGDGMSELGVYRGMEWSIRSVDERVLVSGDTIFGGAGQPVLGDLDGDRRSDPMVHDSVSGMWQVLYSGSGYMLASGVFGVSGYRGLVADYEGVGHGEVSVFHEGNGRWNVIKSDGSVAVWNWGESGYEPVIGDYDGDGHWDMAVYQESTGLWYIRTLNEQLLVPGVVWGGPGCSPVPGDYNGDGYWDAAIYVRASGQWYIGTPQTGQILELGLEWGGVGFEPVMGDYDGDGKWDLAVYHEATGLWYIRSLDGKILAWASPWGGPGYRPIGN
ncbi:MAG: hypothetical protein NT011_09590 [Kiritimatiellaeota bacterium]|nr:hypothetical protein [Kiritimatiellota bacterium]